MYVVSCEKATCQQRKGQVRLDQVKQTYGLYVVLGVSKHIYLVPFKKNLHFCTQLTCHAMARSSLVPTQHIVTKFIQTQREYIHKNKVNILYYCYSSTFVEYIHRELLTLYAFTKILNKFFLFQGNETGKRAERGNDFVVVRHSQSE